MQTNVALSIHNKLHSQSGKYALSLQYTNVNSAFLLYWCADKNMNICCYRDHVYCKIRNIIQVFIRESPMTLISGRQFQGVLTSTCTNNHISELSYLRRKILVDSTYIKVLPT